MANLAELSRSEAFSLELATIMPTITQTLVSPIRRFSRGREGQSRVTKMGDNSTSLGKVKRVPFGPCVEKRKQTMESGCTVPRGTASGGPKTRYPGVAHI